MAISVLSTSAQPIGTIPQSLSSEAGWYGCVCGRSDKAVHLWHGVHHKRRRIGHITVSATVRAARPTLEAILVLGQQKREPGLLSDVFLSQDLLGEAVGVFGVGAVAVGGVAVCADEVDRQAQAPGVLRCARGVSVSWAGRCVSWSVAQPFRSLTWMKSCTCSRPAVAGPPTCTTDSD